MTEWHPPKKIETLYEASAGNTWASINRPTSGAREEKDLPRGPNPIQLYSLSTPNGNKVSILLEELGLRYDPHTIDIRKGDQFTSGFVEVNPNSKIPCIRDYNVPEGEAPIDVFESGSILLYLAHKYDSDLHFLPSGGPSSREYTEMMSWIMWQMSGLGPMCGNFGHFFVYAPATENRTYGVSRYGMEVQRLVSVLETQLSKHEYVSGEHYNIADICIFPWIHQLFVGYPHKYTEDGEEKILTANEFLTMSKYTKVSEWYNKILERPAVQKAFKVCNL